MRLTQTKGEFVMTTLRLLFGLLLGALLISGTAMAQLSGTYTIGSAPRDYPSIAAAVTALGAGVSGAVIFDVQDSTYSSGSVVIGAITGASATWTITFRDEVPGGTRPLISATATPALDLSGADYVTFDGIDITLTINGMVVRITGNADYNAIKNCTLTGASESGSGNYGVYITGGGNDYNVIESATVSRSTYYGVRMSGVSGTRDQGNEVRECTLIGGRYSVYVNYQNGAVVRGCDIQPGYDALSSAFYGIYVTSQTAAELSVAYGNEIHNIRGSGASYAIYVAPGTGGLFKAYNNFVYDYVVTGSGVVYGIYAASGAPEFYFNSVYIGDVGTSGAVYGFYETTAATTVLLKNNIFQIAEPTTACWAINRNNGTLTSDYNCVYSSGLALLYNMGRDGSTDYGTLALWQEGTSRDLNSVEGNPGFISAINLHIHADSGLVHLRGIPIAGITDDIDGDVRLSLPDMGADEYVYNAPNADYWVRELLGWTYLTPELTALTTDAVVVNRGSANQTNVKVTFFYDGLAQDSEYVSLNAYTSDTVTFNWTSPAAPDTILLEAQSFLDGDAVPENDSATATVQIVAPPMHGTYTIGDDPEDNYASFTAAAAALAVRGVDGAVIFDVEALTYNESVAIGAITGASLTNTITFSEAPTHLDTPPEIVGAATPALNLNGAKYVTFDGIDISLTVTGKVVQITGNADYDTIKNCLLTGTGEGLSSNYGVHITGGGNDYNVIENVTITSSVQNPVYMDGASGALDQGNQVRSCTFSGGRHSVYLKYQNGAVVRDCDIQPGRDANTGDLAGIYVTSLGGGTCTVYGNKIHNLRGRGSMMGIYASGMGSGSVLKAYNNFIYDFQGTGTWTEDNLVCGLRVATSGTAEFYFNSVHIGDVQMPYLVCGYHQSASATTVHLKNNVFRVDEPTTPCWGIYVASGTPTLNSDYNAFYSAGPSAVYNMAYAAATNYPHLAAWQAGTGRDLNSVEGDPGFVSAADFHIQSHYSLLNGAGLAIAGITTDIDNEGRGSPPDIGADEYTHTPMAHDYGVKKWVGWIYQYSSGVPVVIQAEVKNYGTSAETDVPVRLYYKSVQQDTTVLLSLTSGLAQTVNFNWTPPVVDVELGMLEVQAFCPSDAFLQNDSLKAEVAVVGGPLCGVYNVGGGSPMDFPTIKAAVTALALVGVNCLVTFNVYPLTYLGPITIDSVLGASATNTITFREAGTLDTPPELVSGPAPTLRLNKADYITFDGIDIATLGNGAVVVITGNADYNAIKNCLVTGGGSQSSVYSFGVDVSSSGANLGDDYNLIENVTINNTVATCVRLGYGSTPGGQGNVVRNCTLIGGYIGVELDYQNEAVVCYNDIQPGYDGSTDNVRGIYPSSQNLGALNTAYGNRIHNLRCGSDGDTYGIYVSVGSPPREFRAYNNFVYDFQGSGKAVGLHVFMGVAEYYFNSVYIGDVAGDSCFGFYQRRSISTTSTAILENNIFQIDDPTSPCYGIYQEGGTLASDYNCFYGTGTAYNVGRDSLTGTNYATLAAWQAGTPYDDNSLEGDPGFIDSANLHIDTLVTLVDSAGTPIDGITNDIDSDPRGTPPDIGADEYNAFYPPPDAVDSLTVFPDTDAGDAILRWAPSAEANSYKVYRGNDYDFVIDGTTYIGQTATTTYTDVGVLATTGNKYYVVIASTDIIARGR
jgi:hypothetical protein